MREMDLQIQLFGEVDFNERLSISKVNEEQLSLFCLNAYAARILASEQENQVHIDIEL